MTPALIYDPASNPGRTQLIYDWAADQYLKTLPLEHFMESTAQSTQREITLESFALVRAVRSDFHVFSELLIQYPVPDEDPDVPARVVPDNMVVIYAGKITARKAFHRPLQPVGPFLVLEYVSESNKRKDYKDNYKKYELDLKVPYYLVFDPDEQDLRIYRMTSGKYKEVVANEAGRLSIPELELEVAILDGWVRYWHCGALLPLPGELLNQLRSVRDQLDAAREQLGTTREELSTAREELGTSQEQLQHANDEIARLRAALAKSQGQTNE